MRTDTGDGPEARAFSTLTIRARRGDANIARSTGPTRCRFLVAIGGSHQGKVTVHAPRYARVPYNALTGALAATVVGPNEV